MSEEVVEGGIRAKRIRPRPRHWVTAVVVSCAVAGTWPCHASIRDTSFTRIELGGATDITNEQYFEDTYSDTLFLGRRLSSTPEVRTGAALSLDHQRAEIGSDWWLRTHLDARLGDKLQRFDAHAQFRSSSERFWRGLIEPSLSLRSDESFGETRREMRSRLAARLSHRTLDEASTFELAGAGELARSQATSADYVLDRDAAELTTTWDHAAPFAATSWRARYTVLARAFPDSASRDHYEHRAEVSLEWIGLGASVSGLAQVERRMPQFDVYSTRDDYWAGQAELGANWRPGGWGAIELALSSEGFRYHLPDSVSYFDYELNRARLAVRRELPRGFAFTAGPLAEWVDAQMAPGERYHEWGLSLDLERSLGGAWWSLCPSAGVRQYPAIAEVAQFSGHSDYRFLELAVLVDQALPLRCRVRLAATVRLEKHDDPSQDARSLYFSVDLRRLL